MTTSPAPGTTPSPPASDRSLRYGGIVLVGGRSTRMGRAKAWLPVAQRTMAAAVVDAVRRGLGAAGETSAARPPVVVVAAAGQDVPPLEDVMITHDRVPDEGPLRGMEAGFAALASSADVAFVASCDTPLLRPALVTHLLHLLGDADIAVPVVDGRHHPLAAAYRVNLLPQVQDLLASRRRRPFFLFQEARTREVAPEELTGVDPTLISFRNVNTPEEYDALFPGSGVAGESKG
jgi:molybdopterin-guanine dinucleotide biosynthesis protein A